MRWKTLKDSQSRAIFAKQEEAFRKKQKVVNDFNSAKTKLQKLQKKIPIKHNNGLTANRALSDYQNKREKYKKMFGVYPNDSEWV